MGEGVRRLINGIRIKLRGGRGGRKPSKQNRGSHTRSRRKR